jgi:hypothetical protein
MVKLSILKIQLKRKYKLTLKTEAVDKSLAYQKESEAHPI